VWFPNHGWVAFDPTPGGSGEAAAEVAWSWPGLLWFDGLQHRWNKWILDYSLDAQMGLLDRARSWLGDDGDSDDGGGRGIPLWLFVLLAAPALAFAVQRLRGGRPAPSGVARRYLALVRSAQKAGIVTGEVAPLQLARLIRTEVPEAGPAASRAVDLYTRSRFGGEPLDAGDSREYRRAVREARKELS
jgi:hypothetical protein